MATVFMFSGQGSQYYQMGRDLYEQDAAFACHLSHLDSILRDVLNFSIVDELYEAGKSYSDPLDETLISGLSLLLVELALTRSLNDKGIRADILLGSSFGTLVASVAANCVGDTEAVSLLSEHGHLFRNHCDPGCMIAVLDDSALFHNNAVLQSNSQLAGINFSSSFVLSLPSHRRPVVEDELRRSNAPYQRLPVARAYHSCWIDHLRERFTSLYEPFGVKTPSIPIVCTSNPATLSEMNPANLWRAVREPMHFQETIAWLETSGPHRYLDVGPSGTLATFLKYLLPPNSASKSFQIMTPFRNGIKNLENMTTALLA